MKQIKKDTSKTFKNLVDHIDTTWSKIKGFHYPFTGRDFKSLKNFTRSFQDWGVASLWDNFLASDSEWVKKSGYSLDAFFKCLPWLVDTDWKGGARKYEAKWLEIKSKDVLDLFKVAGSLEPNFKSVVNQVRKEGLKREGLVA